MRSEKKWESGTNNHLRMNDITKTFEYLKDEASLTEAEKSTAKQRLLSYMEERPLPAAVPSPFTELIVPFMRYAFAALLVVSMGGGIAYAAEQADPSDPLYIVKVRVTEPVYVALTFDPETRASREVNLIDRRLQEIAEASTDGTLAGDGLALASQSLSERIDHVQGYVSALQEDSEHEVAVDIAGDLAAILQTHATMLDLLQDANPDAVETLVPIATEVSTELGETSDLLQNATDQIQNALPDESLDSASQSQAEDVSSAIAQVRADVEESMGEFDASDTADVAQALAEVEATIAAAQSQDVQGDSKEAYLLYLQASQQLTALKVTLEADQALDVDVVDDTTVSSEHLSDMSADGS
jgi:hypothetical protein